jgi:hypothetical protein
MAVLSVAGADILADFNSVTLSIESNLVNGAKSTRRGQTPQMTKKSGRIEVAVEDMISNPDRVSHLDLTAISIDGTSRLGDVRSVDLGVRYTSQMTAGAGELWTKPQNITKDFAITVELDAEDGIASALFIDSASSTYAHGNFAFTFTLNSVTVTIPCRLQSVSLAAQRDDLQRITLTLQGRDPGTGDFPSAPTGTSSILEKALNDFFTPVAIDFHSKSGTGGVDVSGNAIWESFNVRIEDEQLVAVNYALINDGAWTVIATS